MAAVREIALSWSLPTPNTHEPLRVVTSVAVGAPDAAFALATAPIAPEPLVPLGSTPVKLMTVIDETTLWEVVAVTVTLASAAGANARQISDAPRCTLLLFTSVHVRPPPVTVCTVVFVPPRESVAIRASSSSLPAVVENAGVAIVVLAAPRSLNVVASMATAAAADRVPTRRTHATRTADKRRTMIEPHANEEE